MAKSTLKVPCQALAPSSKNRRYFSVPEQASAGEVLLTPEDKVDAVQSAAKSLLGRPFDDQLALDDDGKKLYCTELVAMALQGAGVIKDLPMRSVPFLTQPVIAPDDLVAAVRATVP
jgi:hypothetical protein